MFGLEKQLSVVKLVGCSLGTRQITMFKEKFKTVQQMEARLVKF